MRKLCFIISVLFFTACEDPIVLNIPEGETKLVVEGVITDRLQNQQVKLSTTNGFLDQNRTPKISGATVQVLSTAGTSFMFEETEPGIYATTSPMQGRPGLSYKLQFSLTDGTTYESDFQRLKNVAQVDGLDVEESTEPSNDGFVVTIETTDLEQSGDFYRWRLFRNDAELGTLSDIFLRSDRLFNGNPFSVRFDNFSFERGDICRVEQQSLTESAFDFLRLIQIQAGELGESTSTAPTEVIGNIRNINEPDEEILGFFYATSIADTTVVIQ